jgi:hypothetical protein
MTRRPLLAVLAAIAVGAFGSVIALIPSAGASSNQGTFNVTVLATGTSTMFGPDDIARLGDDLFVSFQNGVSATGGGNSTIAEYGIPGSLGESPVKTWSVPGKCDGLTADPADSRLIGTLNEDGQLESLHPQPQFLSTDAVHLQP